MTIESIRRIARLKEESHMIDVMNASDMSADKRTSKDNTTDTISDWWLVR